MKVLCVVSANSSLLNSQIDEIINCLIMWKRTNINFLKYNPGHWNNVKEEF